jgi:hypothetical protein
MYMQGNHHHHHASSAASLQMPFYEDEDMRKRRPHNCSSSSAGSHRLPAALVNSSRQQDDDEPSSSSASSSAVDFTLASTYVPGILCLVRTSLIIVLMSREWATHSILTLIFLGMCLYVDSMVWQEVIFDSSALTCTIFVTHVLNICRSKIAHVDPLVAPVATVLPAATHPADNCNSIALGPSVDNIIQSATYSE